MFVRQETIGGIKVNVTEQPVDVIPLARAIAEARTREDDDTAFMIVNLDEVYERVKLWKRELPEIEPFYAVKCNPDEVLARMLAKLGVGFDCASREEIDFVTRMGSPPDKIVYANPFKSHKFIEHADAKDVKMMTFDNAEELQKIAKHHKCPEAILRIAAGDPTSSHPASIKFGAGDPVKVAPELLKLAAQLNINIAGVSFYVGSGCNDASSFHRGLQHTRNLFDLGRSLGHKMDIVNIGGGFPGAEHHTPFETFAAIIRSSLTEFFPEKDVRVIAEPGRFFAMRPFTLVTNVIARAAVSADKITKNASDAAGVGHMYYINDGTYGTFSSKRNKHGDHVGRPLHDEDGELFPSIIWGPTCDSIDLVEDNKLMRALNVGDWLIYEDIGAYTCAASTSFNGFPRPTPIHVIGENTWKAVGL